MINMKTPHADLHREFWQEYDKQEYWMGKWYKNHKKQLRGMVEKALRTESKLIDKVEYNKEKGNRWINYLFAHPIVKGRSMTEYYSVCYWEGYGSFGTFSAYRNKGEDIILISTTHYWQRYCERTKAKMQGVHTAMDFYGHYPSSSVDVLPPAEGDTRRQICIHYTCGAAYGVEISEEYHIFELRTFIDNSSMIGEKARQHKQALKTMDSDAANKGIAQVNAMLKMHKGMTVAEAMQYVSNDYMSDTVESIAEHEAQHIREHMAELRKTLTHDQAVEQHVKDPEWDSCNLPEGLLRLHIARNDMQYCEERAEEKFKDFMAFIEGNTGRQIPEKNRLIFHDVYIDGFIVGLDVVEEYFALVFGLDPRYKDTELTSLQEYKHRRYVEMKQYYDKKYHMESAEILYAINTSNARGYDDGMKLAAAMVRKYLGIDIYVKHKNEDNLSNN